MWKEVVAIAVIVLIIGGALFYVIKAKKSGKKCIGCPYSCGCKNTKKGGCSCSSQNNEK